MLAILSSWESCSLIQCFTLGHFLGAETSLYWFLHIFWTRLRWVDRNLFDEVFRVFQSTSWFFTSITLGTIISLDSESFSQVRLCFSRAFVFSQIIFSTVLLILFPELLLFGFVVSCWDFFLGFRLTRLWTGRKLLSSRLRCKGGCESLIFIVDRRARKSWGVWKESGCFGSLGTKRRVLKFRFGAYHG